MKLEKHFKNRLYGTEKMLDVTHDVKPIHSGFKSGYACCLEDNDLEDSWKPSNFHEMF